MSMSLKSIFIGSHFWLAPDGAAFTSPAPGNVSQYAAVWPGANDPNWANWALGICESADVDPKPATGELILSPAPGAVQATDKIIPYAVPEVSFTLLQIGPLAVQLAFNTVQLFGAATTDFIPNGGGGPGIRGILRSQQYTQKNELIINWQSWVFIELKTGLKTAPKTMTKPEFMATLLYAPNNTGTNNDNIA